MHTSSIIMLLSWPVVIALAYFVSGLALSLYEKRMSRQANETDAKAASE